MAYAATAWPAYSGANLTGSGIPRPAAVARKAALCASVMRASPRIQARPIPIASRGPTVGGVRRSESRRGGW
jgi:hypothetical protein